MTWKKLVTGLSAAMISAAMISAAMAGTAMAGTWRTEAGKGPDGKTYEDTAVEVLKATHKVHKDKKSKDGKSMAIDVETDTLKAVVTGGVSATAPALVASYDENGRFLGLVPVTAPVEEPIAPAGDAESVKIFWINENDAPKDDDLEIVRATD